MEIVSERVTIPVGGAGMGGYLARPAADGERAGVLVFQEIFGVNAHIREVTERLAREGWVALAPDLFHRSAPGVELAYDEAGLSRGIELGTGYAEADAVADVKAALGWLRDRAEVRADRVGAIGFCLGGRIAWLAACETDIRAAASFYGGGIGLEGGPVTRAGQIRGRLVALFGGKDPYIPAEQIERVRGALAAAGDRHETVVYEGCDHGFFCDARGSYDEAAAKDAWERVRRLFAEELS